ncbi:glycine--tRNA ligase subunit beta, partial [bacterium]|nr:glycine--tRNA ligase subunit beta [bacterium]
MVKMLFEIGYEEFPPSFVEPTADFLANSIEKMLDEERLACHDVVAYSTSSRIAVLLDGLPDGQPDLKEKVTGAPKRIALGEDGKLTKAGEAFVRKNGLSDYFFEDSKKGEVIAGWKEEEGGTLEEILTEIIDTVLLKIPFKKSMRWGENEFVFARPIRWMLLMLDDKPVEHLFQNIPFSKTSFGHRFLSPEGVTVDFDTYKSVMEEKSVIV